MPEKKINGKAVTFVARISNSFSEDEIEILDFVTKVLLRGGDPRIARRAKAFPSLCKKVLAMKQKAEEKRGRPLPPMTPPSEESVSAASDEDGPSET